tara:strand:+ start:225 stop:425 length:201 start_codon:yes stop_codon:yes gene_type:complete
MSFLTTSIHRVSKVSVSAARKLERQEKSDNSPITYVREIVITGENEETYAITLFSNKNESLPLEVS